MDLDPGPLAQSRLVSRLVAGCRGLAIGLAIGLDPSLERTWTGLERLEQRGLAA
jgi:hypothetical protein